MRTALDVAHLCVTLATEPILRDVSFSVEEGSTLAVIGPNGAGKTMLLRVLIGVIPHTGDVRWAPRTRIGYVPQKLDLERDLPITSTDLLLAKASITGFIAEDARAALRLVGLSERVARRPIGQLSGGEFQRLLLAFALMGRPSVLLFDEPTAGLDEPGVRAVYDLIHRLQRERPLTVILVSHELNVVSEHADRVLCLSRAHTFFGPPDEMLTPERLATIYGRPLRFHAHADHAHRR